MKINYILSVLFITLITSCSKAQKYDFERVTSSEQLDSILQKMKNDGKKIPDSKTKKELNFEGMHYGEIPMLSANIYDKIVYFEVDTSNYAAKQMLEKLESQKGIGIRGSSFSGRLFRWEEETHNSSLQIDFRDGKNLVSMGANDAASFGVSFKNRYNSPLANIHHKIETSEEKPPIYVLNIDSDNVFYSISINGVKLVNPDNYLSDVYLSPFIYSSDFGENDFMLNHFILGSEKQTITIKIAPTKNLNDKTSRFGPSANFSAELYDKSSRKTIDILENIDLENNKATSFQIELTPNLPIYTSGWKDGVDLRKISNLKEKITAVYNALGQAIINKDEEAYSNLIYKCRYERQQALFQTEFNIARGNWEFDLDMMDRVYKYSLSKNFDLEFSDDGKLIYAVPTDQDSMLFLTGKQYSRDLNFYIYQPKDSINLKIIR